MTSRPIAARFDDLRGGGGFALADVGDVLAAHRPDEVADVLRAAEAAARDGNWVAGFVSYEAASGLDPSLRVQSWPVGHPMADLPLVWFGVFRSRSSAQILHPAGPAPTWRPDRSRSWHSRAVGAARAEIARGEFYQVNLTLRLLAEVARPESVYSALSTARHGSYHALLDTSKHTVVSASPELFFERTGDRIVTRPMKGTAARNVVAAVDASAAHRLQRSEKERAENIMIVDLLRNDLGRIAVPGSVQVPTLLEVERYPTVWQLTSTVEARLPPALDLAQVMAALFPCGSVTGAPKRRSMAAIAELEGRPRGVYCGAVGYLEPGQDIPHARFAVAIRTSVVTTTGYAEYGAGGGITYPSQPDCEWDELIAKCAVLGTVVPGAITTARGSTTLVANHSQ